MKTKIILLLVISSVIFLSFTLVSGRTQQREAKHTTTASEPVGGFAAEEKL